MNDEHRKVVCKQLNLNKHLNKTITVICNLEDYKYNYLSVSMGGLIPELSQISESQMFKSLT